MPRVFAPLNDRQRDVLRWVADGCPEGVMEGYTHKTTAVALQGRRLVTVSKKGGRWRAAITDAGAHYLAHGTYPTAPPGRRRRSAAPPSPGPAPNPPVPP